MTTELTELKARIYFLFDGSGFIRISMVHRILLRIITFTLCIEYYCTHNNIYVCTALVVTILYSYHSTKDKYNYYIHDTFPQFPYIMHTFLSSYDDLMSACYIVSMFLVRSRILCCCDISLGHFR